MRLLRWIKRLNLFDSYSEDQQIIKRESWTTRFYLVLLPLTLLIIFIYAAQKELYYTIRINNPSLDRYQQLIDQHSDAVHCPCSQLSVPYSSFLNLTPTFHPICSSNFTSDQWIDTLYYENASSYTPNDIRSVGHAQWQLLRSFCQLSRQAIENAFQATFMSTNLIDSRGMLLQSALVRLQVDALIHDFVSNLDTDHRRQRALFANFLDRNFLVSGLQTAARPTIDSLLNLKIETRQYIVDDRAESQMATVSGCFCDASYDCAVPLAVWDNTYTMERPANLELVDIWDHRLQDVAGFKAGCLPYNGLLSSTLECFYNQHCVNNVTRYLENGYGQFSALNQHVENQSMLSATIETFLEHLMVQSWEMQMNYSEYFRTCRPHSCSYSYSQRFDVIYIIATLLGLLSGLIKIFRFICPRLTDVVHWMRKPHPRVAPNQNAPSFRVRIQRWFAVLKGRLLSLNLFKKRDSGAVQVQQQILTTRLYIGSLLGFTIVLVAITALEPRIETITLVTPSVSQFEELYQSEKLPYSCPCSEIAIQRSNFITLSPLYHQVCSSALVTDDWLDRLSYSTDTRSKYYYFDIRSYGLDMFRTILSFCSFANQTTTDAIFNFLSAYWIGNRVVPREQFHQQIEAVLGDFQSSLKYSFKQWFTIAREVMQGNQVLSSRQSNFFFDALFDESGDLMHVQTYLGIKLSTNGTLPTCSCVSSTCSQPLGFFRFNDFIQNFILIIEVPGMFSACYPLDALRVSTLECWFNSTCINMVFSNLNPFPVERQFEPLNASVLINYAPTTPIGDIIDHLMIEQLLNDTQYEKYYNSCKPLVCTYTSIDRFDWLYIITTFLGVFSGLSLCLRLICPLVIKIYIRLKQRRTIIRIDAPLAPQIKIRSNRIHRLKRLLIKLNLFNSQSPHAHIQKRERLATYLYLVLFVIIIIIITIYLLFVGHTRTVTVAWPSSHLVSALQQKYSTALSCPCTQTALPYSIFVSLKVERYHPICSSAFLTADYLRMLMSDNLAVMPESTLFKRQFLGSQLSLLASLCKLSEQTLTASIFLFLRQQFINVQALTPQQFDEQINMNINRFYLDLSLSMRYSMDYLESMIHGNTIMTTYVSNWRFYPDTTINSSKILTEPVWYENCSCARSSQCSMPISIDNQTFPGLFMGCLPSSALLQSTYECFYNQTCIDLLHTALFNTSQTSLLPKRVNMSNRFQPNKRVVSLFDALFVESWIRQYDYEAFFQACAIPTCSYSYTRKPDLAYVITTLVGLIGGLNIILRLVCPLVVIAYPSLMDIVLKRNRPFNQR